MDASRPEPLPKPGMENVAGAVLVDIKARIEMGERKYGTVLQTHNGRDALMDAYQEAIDLVFYLKQAIMECKKETINGRKEIN